MGGSSIGNEDLLLRIQSDVAKAVSDLQTIATTLSSVKSSSEATATGISALNTSASAATSGFSKFQATLVSFAAGVSLVREGIAGAHEVISTFSDVTIGAAENFAKFAQQLDNTTRQMGVSSGFAQVLQAMRIRLQEMGQGADTGEYALRLFSRTVEQAAQGAGTSALLFQRLGIQVNDMSGQLRPTEAILSDVAQAFGGMNDGAAKVALSMQLFGRQGPLLLPILAQMKDGTAAFTEQLQQLGFIMSDDLIKAGQKFNQEWAGVSTTIEAGKRVWGAYLAEALMPVVRLFREDLQIVMQLFVEHSSEVKVAIDLLIAPLAVLERAFHGVVFEATGLVEVFHWLGLAASAAEGNVRPLAEALGLLDGATQQWVARSAHAAGSLDLLNQALKASSSLTQEQVKAEQAATDKLLAAAEQKKTALIEETQGKRAALDEEYNFEQQQAAQAFARQVAALKDSYKAQGLAFNEHSTEMQQLRLQYDLAQDTAKQTHDAKVMELTDTQNKKIKQLDLDAALAHDKALIAIDVAGIKARLDLHQISAADAAREEGAAAVKELDDEKQLLQKKLDNDVLEVAERKTVQDRIAAIDDQIVLKKTQTEDLVVKATQKSADDQRKVLDSVAEYYNKAFGTAQQ